MANILLYCAFILTWVRRLYHMFLLEGGYWHFLTYEKVLPKWKSKMVDLPTVSVFIPAHNEEVVIGQTLQAMSQLYYPKDKIEIIVINDNSSDRTGEIAQSYANKYHFIHVIDTRNTN